MTRPTIGDVGRTVSALTPDGEVEFDGIPYAGRAQGANIDAEQNVVVTGFDPRFLVVRLASPEERPAPRPLPAETSEDSSWAYAGQWAVGALIFAFVLVVGSFGAFAGEVAAVGYLFAVVGLMWLLVLIVRVCHPSAIFWALAIPIFFSWYFAIQRWDVARWALLLNLLGILLYVLGIILHI
jgi:hypothetical protein